MEEKLNQILTRRFGTDLDQATRPQIYAALLQLTQAAMADMPPCAGKRKLYYVSAEFLIGKLLSNNLISLGLFDEARAVLARHGLDLAEIEEEEREPSLGNGGLGRLAACFLDSIAALDLPGDGAGLNYHDGLFYQDLKDLRQREVPNLDHPGELAHRHRPVLRGALRQRPGPGPSVRHPGPRLPGPSQRPAPLRPGYRGRVHHP